MAVCLHCLHAERVAARDRRQRIVIRFTLWTVVLAVVGVVGAAAAEAVVGGPAPQRVARPAQRVARTTPKPQEVAQVASMPVIPQGEAMPSPNVSGDSVRPQTPGAVPAPPVDSSRAPTTVSAIVPIVPPGRSEMADSMFAVRSGDTVVVHFDTSPSRTRRADKFERIVRQTLRAVYGTAADTLLAAVPEGRLVAPAELLTVLPARGIRLEAPGGRHVTLWPETRPGRDGPLVVAYRAIAVR